MDWEKIITCGIIGIAVNLALSYMNRGASQEIAKNKNGEIELRMNNPFSDGNKRTGYILMQLILLKSNLDSFAYSSFLVETQ